MAHIFLIGPGGVGKTTVGLTLAHILRRRFVDLDQEFCNRVAPIPAFLDANGYPAYLHRNAQLFREMLKREKQPAVFALSSGFLVSEAEPETITTNRKLVTIAGVSVLLMPSEDFQQSLNIVVERQVRRGLSLKRDSEKAKFAKRFEAYMELGDVRIYGTLPPEVLARDIAEQLSLLGLD